MEWIEIEESPPEEIGLQVWLYPFNDQVVLSEYVGEGFFRIGNVQMYGTYFTHWMIANIPKPPKE